MTLRCVIIRPHRMHTEHRCASMQRGLRACVCVPVGHKLTCAKTAEPAVPFGGVDLDGPINWYHCLF